MSEMELHKYLALFLAPGRKVSTRNISSMTYFNESFSTRLFKYFFLSDAFGKTGPDGNTLRTIEKIGNPNANFGQPLHGGLSKIDQRQINILYCEGKKLGVVKDELETTSRHALEEYEGSSWREFGAMLKSRLSKIYEDYWFTIIQLGKNVAKRNFAFQHNGNCIEPISQFGRTLVVCWVRKDSFIRATEHRTAVRVYHSVRKAVRDIEVSFLVLF